MVHLKDKAEKYHGACQPQTTIWRMCIACWTPTATYTHSE